MAFCGFNTLECIFYIHFILILAFLAELISRLFYCCNEYAFFKNHYKPLQPGIGQRGFSCNFSTFLLLCVVVFMLPVLFHFDRYKQFITEKSFSEVIGIFVAILICKFSRIYHSDLENVYLIRNAGYDYGSGMAQSFYHGYLNIIGPMFGDDRKGIVERIENYEDTQEVNVPVKRLFIIVPETFYVPAQLSEKSSILDSAKSLDMVIIDRGGVRKRPYQNSMYKIRTKNNFYICAEGATPILTFGESCKDLDNADMNKMKAEILLKFCKSLKKILYDDEKTRNKFEIVLYDGVTDLGELLEKRILQILDENNTKKER